MWCYTLFFLYLWIWKLTGEHRKDDMIIHNSCCRSPCMWLFQEINRDIHIPYNQQLMKEHSDRNGLIHSQPNAHKRGNPPQAGQSTALPTNNAWPTYTIAIRTGLCFTIPSEQTKFRFRFGRHPRIARISKTFGRCSKTYRLWMYATAFKKAAFLEPFQLKFFVYRDPLYGFTRYCSTAPCEYIVLCI